MTLTVDQLREHLNTTLGDDALKLKLDAAYGLIAQRIGSAEQISERHYPSGPLLMLNREADAVTEVLERGVELEEDTDYVISSTRQTLRRLAPPNWFWTSAWAHASPIRWFGPIDVSYLPVDDAPLRDETAVRLVELEVNFPLGLTQRTIGNYSESFEAGRGIGSPYEKAREAILSGLRAPAWIL